MLSKPQANDTQIMAELRLLGLIDTPTPQSFTVDGVTIEQVIDLLSKAKGY